MIDRATAMGVTDPIATESRATAARDGTSRDQNRWQQRQRNQQGQFGQPRRSGNQPFRRSDRANSASSKASSAISIRSDHSQGQNQYGYDANGMQGQPGAIPSGPQVQFGSNQQHQGRRAYQGQPGSQGQYGQGQSARMGSASTHGIRLAADTRLLARSRSSKVGTTSRPATGNSKSGINRARTCRPRPTSTRSRASKARCTPSSR